MKYGFTSAPIQLAPWQAMSSVKPWRPDEPAATIHAEGAWLQGAFISKIFYGIIIVLSWQCLSLLWRQTTRSNYKTKMSFLAIVFAIFSFSTLHSGYDMKAIQLGFVENRNFPGGPSAYATLSRSDTPGNIACILMQWLCDALLVSCTTYLTLRKYHIYIEMLDASDLAFRDDLQRLRRSNVAFSRNSDNRLPWLNWYARNSTSNTLRGFVSLTLIFSHRYPFHD